MKQLDIGLKKIEERQHADMERVAYCRFSKSPFKPNNFDAAMNDPVFCKLIKARATQLLRSLDKKPSR